MGVCKCKRVNIYYPCYFHINLIGARARLGWVGEMVATLVVTWDSGVSELNATKFTQLFSAIHYSCVQPERIALFHLVITILLIFHAVLSCILDIAFWLLYLVMGV